MKRALAVLLAVGLTVSQGTEVCMASVLNAATTAHTVVVEEVPTENIKASGKVLTLSPAQGSDITVLLDDTLEQARDMATDANPVTVKLAKGTYVTSANLHIYSNTILDLQGSTLKYSDSAESHNMLMAGTNGAYKGETNYNESASCKGYGGFKNITVKNGTFQSSANNTATIIRIAHATNVTLENVTLAGGGCEHQMEVAAIDGFYVKGCTFKDFGKSGADIEDKNKQEALQLDIPCSTDVYPAVYQDGTPMKNVEITGCTFSNVPRGVGTHTMLLGAYHENIKINNNTFNNVMEEAIVGLNYYNCEIKGNKINNCGAGILFQNFKNVNDIASVYTTIFDGKKVYDGTFRTDLKTEISGNDIKVKYSKTCSETQGIKVEGRKIEGAKRGGDNKVIAAGEYYIGGVTIKGNNIETAGFGVHMIGTQDCVISGQNVITGSGVSSADPEKDKYDAILIESGAKNVTVSDNTISNMVRNGIFVQEEGSVSSVTGNTISDCKEKGINFYRDSSATGDIANNTITNCKGGAILVSTRSAVGNITSNIIKNVDKEAGITLFKDSTSGDITKNIITDMGKAVNGIKLTTGCTSGDITANMIKKQNEAYAAMSGILVFQNSTIKGAIANNEIGKTADKAISISTKCKVTGNIESNKMDSTDDSSIYVFKNSTINGSIKGNTINKAKRTGIYLTDGAKVKGNVEKNKISNVGEKGIYVYNKSSVKAIKNNTIKNTGSQGINLASTTNKVTISGNKVSGASDNVIMIQPGTTKHLITINSNKITGNKKIHGIRVIDGTVSIADNNISTVARGVFINKGVKGTVYGNTYSGVKEAKVWIAGSKIYKLDQKALNVKSAKAGKEKATVKWSKVAGASGYEIEYSEKKDFSKSKTYTVKKGKAVSATIPKLTSKKTYYVRVRSYTTCNGVKVYGNFGNTKTVTVK